MSSSPAREPAGRLRSVLPPEHQPDYFIMVERTTSFGSALPGRCCCFYGYFILFWTICVGLAQGLGAQLLFNITESGASQMT